MIRISKVINKMFMLCFSKLYELKKLTLSISATIMTCIMVPIRNINANNAVIMANLFPLLNTVEAEQHI
jgi:hypothetical protein